jgi:NAD(P)-dependent dehydrogenase (short-subunit alcohol dehydrogenase family)
MDIAGQAVLVTGGSSGLGFAAGALLAAAGARVALIARRPSLLAAKAQSIGALALACDVIDPAAVDQALDSAQRQHGVARLLVHAAADAAMTPLLDDAGRPAPIAGLKAVVETNLLGTLWVVRAFAARLVKAEPLPDGLRGLAILISSTGALDGTIGSTYAASKGGVEALTLPLARELGHWGIRVVTIAPGAMDTELLRAQASPALGDLLRATVPALGRAGDPAEFARLVRAVCETDYLNGCSIRLDGGFRVPFRFDLGGRRDDSAAQAQQ